MNVFIPYVRFELMLIATALLFVVVRATTSKSPAVTLFAVGLPTLFGFALVTSLKDGSGGNYYNEFTVLAVTAVAYAARQLQLRFPASIGPAVSLGLAATVIVILPVRAADNVYRFTYGRSEPHSLRPLRRTQLAAYDELATYLRTNTHPDRGEYIITFDRGLMTVLPFHTIAPQTELAASRYWTGLSPMTEFRTLIERGQVRYVVFMKGQIWPDLLGVPVTGYFEPFKEYPEQSVYRSRPPRPPLQP
jgi:hypothetical protein